MSYSRSDFKLSFLKSSAQFFVNEKKRIVSCVVEGELQSPYSWDSSVTIGCPTFKATGVATCKEDDVFDVERGKRIALAVAENDIYSQAKTYLSKAMKELLFFTDKITDFAIKSDRCREHNKDYITSIHDKNHPMYKTNVDKFKHGYTNGKPNWLEK
jgi:hypothetical protein